MSITSPKEGILNIKYSLSNSGPDLNLNLSVKCILSSLVDLFHFWHQPSILRIDDIILPGKYCGTFCSQITCLCGS